MATKQKSGLYRTKVKIGTDENGKPINKWVSGSTKKELEQAKQNVIEYYITGTAAGGDITFGDFTIEWYNTNKKPFISHSTHCGYRTMLNKHIFPAFADRHMRAIRPVELQAFINEFEGASKSQITNALTLLNAIFAAAKAERIVLSNPAENLRKPASTPPKTKSAFTEDERRRIVEQTIQHPHGDYLAVMYYTGMRPGEVRGLKWGDFDWDAKLIHVQRDIDYAGGEAVVGTLKTKAADRYIPITAELESILYPKRELPDTFLFRGKNGNALAEATARRWWISLMAACGMAEDVRGTLNYSRKDIRGTLRPTVTPHTMRHNFITMCWEQGLDIMLTMKIVGHADYQTTRNIYTHLSSKNLNDAKLQLDSMFKKSCTKVAQDENPKIFRV